VFFGNGLWDYAESLQGTLNSYDATKGLREIAVVHGPHAEGQLGPEYIAYMTGMIEFAQRAVRNEKHLRAPEPATTADILDTSPPYYEPSTVPVYQ
jgi:hypothetical protein